ncbi:MAG: hypothetical protein PHU24_01785 [Sphaerochaetaceae bacterium]|jgi:hypothetical protein|nr:hypothetical protein [Sphaerochaetaceae bacterium]NLO60095.1 hypothetical protein [Spirochaetales bacterium]MDD2405168.1 hypothetical protein [Sphaerochaetaceae bacterium]MDD3670057.1 hypothetical protein [Sphaerochaetaceae bacterium]MDD4259338.1 hypothetical protein [Sphaerochaetaceae bacterium]
MTPHVLATTIQETPYALGVKTDVFWYVSIPDEMHLDQLPIRSHTGMNFTFQPVAFEISDNLQVSLDLDVAFVSESFDYGNVVWSSFFAIGAGLDMVIRLDQHFSIATNIAYMVSSYSKYLSPSNLLRVSVAGELYLIDQKHILSLTLPIRYYYRPDYHSFSVGVGLKWQLTGIPVIREQL